MPETLPYISNPGTITTALNKMMQAECPPKFSKKFLNETLAIKGGTANAIMPFLRYIGFLDQTNTPTELYRKFKNPHASKTAVAEAIRFGYKPIFKRIENAHDLSSDKLKGLVIEILGDDQNSVRVKLVVRCFLNLMAFADFSSIAKQDEIKDEEPVEPTFAPSNRNYDMNLSYTIN